MANNRTYFWNKITGEVIYLWKHYNDPMYINDENMKKIQKSINNSIWKLENDWITYHESCDTIPCPDWYEGKCPFVFFSENIEDRDDYKLFYP